MVSIIIPYKNPNPFFKECLNSIINQTYKNLQIILVNDHSTDDSEKTASNYQKTDSRIKTIKNKGSGIIDALNTGVKVANGKFITRMDSDDIMTDNKIAELRTLLLISGRQHISLGCVKYFASDKKMGEGYINYAKWLNELTTNSKNYTEIYKECTLPSSNWMMFRKDFNEINGFNCQEPNGAFYCFPNIEKTNKSSTVIQNLLLDKIGVATVAGTSFGKYGEGFIRLSCANSDAAIEEAVDRIKSIF